MANALGHWFDRRIDTSEHNLEFNKITEGVIIGDDLTQTTSTPYRFTRWPRHRMKLALKAKSENAIYIQSDCCFVFAGIDFAITVDESQRRSVENVER